MMQIEVSCTTGANVKVKVDSGHLQEALHDEACFVTLNRTIGVVLDPKNELRTDCFSPSWSCDESGWAKKPGSEPTSIGLSNCPFKMRCTESPMADDSGCV